MTTGICETVKLSVILCETPLVDPARLHDRLIHDKLGLIRQEENACLPG